MGRRPSPTTAGDPRLSLASQGAECERKPAMTKWEYATVPLLPHNTKQILDVWGEDGWELVAIHTAEVGGTVAFFKRPKQ
jgi:hypothetical protein